MTETIQTLKEDIAILQEKLRKLEELQRTKSPAEKAYYSVYGWYPPTTSSVSNYEDNRWRDFQNGYDAAYEEKVVEEETEREMIKRNLKTSLQELVNGDVRPIDDVVRETKNQQIKELVRESVKWCEEHPDETIRAMKDYVLSIKGPLATPVGGGIRSLNVALRQQLDLYVCLRPIRYFEGVPSPLKRPADTNMVIFRENTEDIYAGIEYESGSNESAPLFRSVGHGGHG